MGLDFYNAPPPGVTSLFCQLSASTRAIENFGAALMQRSKTDLTAAAALRVDVATLPPFSNHRAVCARCGARYEIRVHFDRGCELARGGDHFHRLCRCG